MADVFCMRFVILRSRAEYANGQYYVEMQSSSGECWGSSELLKKKSDAYAFIRDMREGAAAADVVDRTW